MATFKKWTSTVLVNGQPEPNVKVYVYEPGTTNEIPIYEDEGVTQITQPILTDSQGRYAFFVDVDAYPEIRLYLEKDGVDFSEVNEDLDGVPVPGAGGGAGTFTELTDTPSSYVGRGGDVVVVKNTEDGIETQPWPVTGTVLNVFLSSDAADIGDYYYMYHTETGDTHSEFTSPSLSTGNDQLLWSFVTEAGQPGLNQLALGAYTATLFLKKSGNKDVRVYWKLFKRDTSGNETEILESAVSDHLTTDNSQYLISAYLNEDQVLDPTDRLVLKLYANVSGTGTDVTVTLTMEGDYDSRLTINVLSSAFNFDRLSDTPSSKTGAARKYVRVSADETALEFDGAADMEMESRTIYVDADNGSDTTGDGSEGNPYQTIEGAMQDVRNVIADGVTITLHLKAATNQYPGATIGRLCIGTGVLRIEGELEAQESGTVSSASATSITDTSKSWTADQWKGYLCKVTSGGTDYYRLIDSNTADTLTLVGRLDVTPAEGDAYEILDWGSVLSSLEIAQGTITLSDLKVDTTGDHAVRLEGDRLTLNLERCCLRSDKNALNTANSQFSSVIADTTFFEHFGSSNAQAIFLRDRAGFYIRLKRCYITTTQWNCIDIFGTVTAFVQRGTVIDGQGVGGISVAKGMAVLWSPSVNGATDKITIRNCSTGLNCSRSGGATYSGTGYVVYSGNTTDRSANSATYGWYTDT